MSALVRAGSNPRGGLGPIRDALRTRPCNIGYLGASVTAQKSGYVPSLHAGLIRETGQAHVATVAAIGGVGSISGVFLMDDLLDHRPPDLCLVEFTPADVVGYTPLDRTGPAVEGILRKLIRQGIQPVLLHLFRTGIDFGPENPVVSAYERVAEHYGVPTLDLASRWMRDGAWVDGAYLRDNVHLSESGAAVCAAQVLEELLAFPEGPGADTAAAERAPLHPDAYDETRIVGVDSSMLDRPERASSRTFRFNYSVLDVEPGGSVHFEMDAGVTGLLAVVGPRSGIIEWEDPDGLRQHQMFDEYCHYERLNTVIFTRGGRDVPWVSVRLTLDAVDPSICRRPVEPCLPPERRLSIIGFLTRA